ncbi:MAG: hypothetical protein ACOC3Z_03355 [Nanoarchaeota archaeon]
MKNLEEGNIVMCTVENISGTIVFVKIDETGQQGSIVFSEVAPGRIRNIRNYVVPNKKIVCKILRIRNNQIDLSLRRVRPNEEKELKERYKQETKIKNALKGLLGKEKANNIIKDIEKENDFYEFFQESLKEPKKIEKLLGKENSEKIINIIDSQSKKESKIKKEITLKSKEPEGIKSIQKILENKKDNIDIKYISPGKYSLQIKGDNIKELDKELKDYLDEIEKKSKKYKIDFSIKKK